MAYGMEVSTQKSKFTTNSTNNISADISVNGQKLEEITSFTCARMAPAQHQDCLSNDSNGHTKPDLEVNTVSCTSKFKLYNSLFTTILSSSLAVKHGPSMLTLKKRIQAFETKCLRKLFRISYLDHKTNDWVQGKIHVLVDPQEPLLATVKRRKLAWFGHITLHDSFSKYHSSGHLGGWATPWSAEEILDEQHQRVEIPARARTAHKGLLHKRLGEDLCWIVLDINQPSLPIPFYSFLLSISVFMALSSIFHSTHSPDNSPCSHSVLPVLSLPYWSFQLYISLWKSPSALI